MRSRLLMVLAPLALACSGELDRIDPYPVAVDMSAGPVMITVSADDGPPIPGLVDTLSPVTILDSFVPGEPEQSPRRRQVELVLHTGAVDASTPRVAFSGVSTFDLHPCTGVDALCTVGLDDQTRAVQAVVGSDVLARTAVRFDVAAGELSFFPDIAGDDTARARACEAVFTSPFAGGGTIVLSGSEVPFTGNRIALGACLHHDPSFASARSARGTDTLMILSTGVAISVLSASAYARYQALVGDAAVAPPRAALPTATLELPSGPMAGRLASVTRMAVVGGGTARRGPCQELYANHVMADDACNSGAVERAACPCTGSQTFCPVAAAVEVERAFPVLVVDDLDPLLQALRDELRPDHAEVDGILALGALTPLSIDVDYPNSRVIARCTRDTDCQSRPAVRNRDSRSEVTACLPAAVDPVDAP